MGEWARIRELRVRVKVARAAVATPLGLAVLGDTDVRGALEAVTETNLPICHHAFIEGRVLAPPQVGGMWKVLAVLREGDFAPVFTF